MRDPVALLAEQVWVLPHEPKRLCAAHSTRNLAPVDLLLTSFPTYGVLDVHEQTVRLRYGERDVGVLGPSSRDSHAELRSHFMTGYPRKDNIRSRTGDDTSRKAL